MAVGLSSFLHFLSKTRAQRTARNTHFTRNKHFRRLLQPASRAKPQWSVQSDKTPNKSKNAYNRDTRTHEPVTHDMTHMQTDGTKGVAGTRTNPQKKQCLLSS